MGQALSTYTFYQHGKKHFTATGFEAAQKTYKNGVLEAADLTDKVCIVTGANSGIGKELTKFLASKNASVYMVCRNRERGEAARQEIVDASGNDRLHLLIGDCSLKADVVRVVEEFNAREQNLHCLVCNAGALLNDKHTTNEGFEVTFATHLLFGTYTLAKLLMPTLQNTPESRFVCVTSGGMYNTKFPSWARATGQKSYNGNLAYAYAKRGQVLLLSRWANMFPEVPMVTSHPGWTDTPGVEAAYGGQKSWLEPLRSLWQGTEGIAWLCCAPRSELQSGSLYLDRLVQPFHLVSRTHNTTEEVDFMMAALEKASDTADPNALPTEAEVAAAAATRAQSGNAAASCAQ